MSRASNNYDQLFRYIIVGDMGKKINNHNSCWKELYSSSIY